MLTLGHYLSPKKTESYWILALFACFVYLVTIYVTYSLLNHTIIRIVLMAPLDMMPQIGVLQRIIIKFLIHTIRTI